MEYTTNLQEGRVLITGQDDNGMHYGIIRDSLGFIESMTITTTPADLWRWENELGV